MLTIHRMATLCCLVFLLALVAAGAREPRVVSTYGMTAAVESAGGFHIAPTPLTAPPSYTEDLAPPQVFELVRPGHLPVTVGRLLSSCTCLEVSMEKRSFGPGEKALITVRNVKPTPPDGAMYILFVEVTEPARETLQFYARFKSTAPAAMQPPRPNVPPAPLPGPPPGPTTPPTPSRTPRPGRAKPPGPGGATPPRLPAAPPPR